MRRLDFYLCRQTRRSGFKVHSLPRLRHELICHERPAACKNVAIDSTKSTAHIDRIKVSVTGTMKRDRVSRSPRAWMSRFAPQHSSAVSQHTCCLCHGSPLVLFPFRLFVNEEAGQALDITNCWPNATFVAGAGACDITSSLGAVWDLGQAQVYCVVRAGAPLCTRPGSSCHVTSIVLRSECATLAFSQCEVVWEKHSAPLIQRNSKEQISFY